MKVSAAARILREGGVLAYPTEAVYGLGCDPRNEQAVRRILDLKNRAAESGVILIADRFERFEEFAADVPAHWLKRACASWPGPVTWLFPRRAGVPDWLAGTHPTIALRVTAHPLCRELCAAFGGALVSTSANPRSANPARTPAEVRSYFGGRIDGIVEGALGRERNPTEIRDLATGELVRKG